MATHIMWVKRPLLAHLRARTKKVEIRSNTTRFRVVVADDTIVFNPDNPDMVSCRVREVKGYRSLDCALDEIPAEDIWPGMSREELEVRAREFIHGRTLAFFLD